MASVRTSTRPQCFFTIGLPGAGKTTWMKDKMKELPPLSPVTWSAADAGPGMKSQKVTFMADEDLDHVVIGIYKGDIAETRHELVGPDLYTTLQRTRIKFVLEEIARRNPLAKVWCDGLILINKPFLDVLFRVYDVIPVTFETPRTVCQERFRTRNTKMVDEGRLPHYPLKFNKEETWDKIQARIDSFILRTKNGT